MSKKPFYKSIIACFYKMSKHFRKNIFTPTNKNAYIELYAERKKQTKTLDKVCATLYNKSVETERRLPAKL